VEKEVRALEMEVCRRVVAFVGKMVKQVMLVHSAANRQRGYGSGMTPKQRSKRTAHENDQ
jgi:hypothetical protein